MAGNFEGKKMKEYNVVKDVPSARKLFRKMGRADRCESF